MRTFQIGDKVFLKKDSSEHVISDLHYSQIHHGFIYYLDGDTSSAWTTKTPNPKTFTERQFKA